MCRGQEVKPAPSNPCRKRHLTAPSIGQAFHSKNRLFHCPHRHSNNKNQATPKFLALTRVVGFGNEAKSLSISSIRVCSGRSAKPKAAAAVMSVLVEEVI